MRAGAEGVTLIRMKIRFRSLAALVALIALSLFWVEGLWASMCPTAMEMGGPTAEVADMGPASDACPTGMPLPGDSDGGRSDAPHCPFVPVGASYCAVGVPLAADVGTPEVPSSEGASLAGSPDHAKDLLLAVALFHPPRA